MDDELERFTSVTESLVTALRDKLVGWLETFFSMLPNIVVALLVMLVTYFFAKGVAAATNRLLLRTTKNRPIADLMGSVSRVATLLLGLFVALGLLQLDKTVTSLIAGLGVLGIAAGFAFQDIASNFMAGFMMAIRRPFELGDTVEVAGKVGTIKSLELRATVIQTLDGLVVTVPNKDVFQSAIINYTSTPERRMDLAVGVAYDSPLKKVKEIAQRVGSETKYRDEKREPVAFFLEFGDSSINLVLRVWLNAGDELTYHHARSDALIRLKAAFDENSITIPFPIRTLDFGADVVGGVPLAERMRQAG